MKTRLRIACLFAFALLCFLPARAFAEKQIGKLVFDSLPEYCFADETGAKLAPEFFPRIVGDGEITCWGYIDRDTGIFYQNQMPITSGKFRFFFMLGDTENYTANMCYADMIYFAERAVAESESVTFGFILDTRESVYDGEPQTIAIVPMSTLYGDNKGVSGEMTVMYLQNGTDDVVGEVLDARVVDENGAPIAVTSASDDSGGARYFASVTDAGTYTATCLVKEPLTVTLRDYTRPGAPTIAARRVSHQRLTFVIRKAARAVDINGGEPISILYDGTTSIVSASAPVSVGAENPKYTVAARNDTFPAETDGVFYGMYTLTYQFAETKNYLPLTLTHPGVVYRKLPAPTNVRLDDSHVQWSGEHKQKYRLRVFQVGVETAVLDRTGESLKHVMKGAYNQDGVGTYYAEVSATPAFGYELESAPVKSNMFTYLPTPANVRWDGISLCWDAAEDAQSYTLTLYRNQNLAYTASLSFSVTDCDLRVQMTAPGTYYAEIAANYGMNQTSEPGRSPNFVISQLACPDAPEIVSSGDNRTITTKDWAGNEQFADARYELTLYRNDTLLATKTLDSASAARWDVSSYIQNSGIYTAKIRAVPPAAYANANVAYLPSAYAESGRLTVVNIPQPSNPMWSKTDPTVATWGAVEGAVSYDVSLIKDRDTVVLEVTDIRATTFDFGPAILKNGSGVYDFSVLAVDAAGNKGKPAISGVTGALTGTVCFTMRVDGASVKSRAALLAKKMGNTQQSAPSQPGSYTMQWLDVPAGAYLLKWGNYSKDVVVEAGKTTSVTVDYVKVTYVTNIPNAEPIRQDEWTEIPLTPPSVSRVGYRLAGWYKDAALMGSPVAVGYVNPGAGLTLYAKWEPNTYIVAFDTGVAGLTLDGLTVKYDSLLAEPSLARDGYEIAYWQVKDGAKWSFDTDTVAGNMTLVAHWTPKSYTLTFDADNGGAPAVQSVAFGADVVLPDPPEKAGYEFAGWTWDCGDAPATMPAKDVVAKAMWTSDVHTITFLLYEDEAHPEGVSYEKTYKTGDPVAREDAPSRTGYQFAGWIWDTDDGRAPAVMPARDMEAYAQWTPLPYTITYMSLGSVYDTRTYDCGAAIDDPPVPERAGSEFVCWTWDCGSRPETMPAKNVVATAVWYTESSGKRYTVTYEYGESDAYPMGYTATQSYAAGDTIVPPKPNRDGFTFLGWVWEPVGVYTTMPAYDLSAWAQWEPITPD